MEHPMYPDTTKEIARKRRELAPEISSAFRAFGQRVFADGALPEKTKQLIAVAVAHVTQCPYCIRGHTELAVQKGATEPEIMAKRLSKSLYSPCSRKKSRDNTDGNRSGRFLNATFSASCGST